MSSLVLILVEKSDWDVGIDCLLEDNSILQVETVVRDTIGDEIFNSLTILGFNLNMQNS